MSRKRGFLVTSENIGELATPGSRWLGVMGMELASRWGKSQCSMSASFFLVVVARALNKRLPFQIKDLWKPYIGLYRSPFKFPQIAATCALYKAEFGSNLVIKISTLGVSNSCSKPVESLNLFWN